MRSPDLRPSRRWGTVLLLFVSLSLALVTAELLTRRFVPVRDVGALFTVNDPVLGKRIKKNYHTVRVTPEFTMTFTTNSLGFRGPEPASSLMGSVLFLGDSFTMGFGVNDGEEYPALVKARLDASFGPDAVVVVNAGMGNNGNGRWIKLLRTDVDQFNPRLVVFQVSANDSSDNVREALFGLTEDGTLRELPVRITRMKSLEPYLDRIPGLSSSHFYSLIRQTLHQLLSGDGAVKPAVQPGNREAEGGDDYSHRLTERLITEAVSITRRKGWRALTVLVGFEGDALVRMQSVFDSLRVATLAIPTKAQRPDLYYRIDGHWNAAGHAFVADAVFDRLRSLNLLPVP